MELLESGRAYGIFGSRIAYQQTSFDIFANGNSNSNFQDDYNTQNYVALASPIGKYKIDKNKNATTINNVSHSFTAASFQLQYNAFLFGISTSGSSNNQLGSLRVYSCQISDNGTLIRDYIPCKNESGAVGLWDDVNSVFYGNAGTGVFAAGPEVIHPPTYSPAIMAISITPNPAYVGDTVLISISAMDIAVEPSVEIRGSGEFYSGEV